MAYLVLLLLTATALLLPQSEGKTDLKLGIVSLASGSNYNLMGKLSHRNHARFAELHGLQYIAANNTKYIDPRLPAQWWKCHIMIDWLPQFDWLLWIDADALFCDPELDLLSYIREAPSGTELIAAQDIDASLFNTGVFWLRNSSWSLHFMERVLARGLADSRIRNHGFYEQLAMQLFYRKSPTVRKKIFVIPNRRRHEINGFVIDGSFRRPGMGVLHNAGCRFRMDAQECQRWHHAFYCMCLNEPGDIDCPQP